MTVLNLTVGASADDAHETSGGVVTLTPATPLLQNAGWVGVRYQNVTVPNGATIDTATLSVYVSSTLFDSPALAVHAEDADTAAQFTTGAYDISTRTRTTASVTWSATDIGVGWKSPSDLAAVIQEVVDRPGWVSGNALALIVDGNTGCSLQHRHYDYTSDAPTLDITYTASVTTIPVGQATETDIGQVATAVRRYTVGQAAETDTGQAATAARRYTVGQATETDTGLALIAVSREATLAARQARSAWAAGSPTSSWAAGAPVGSWHAGTPST